MLRYQNELIIILSARSMHMSRLVDLNSHIQVGCRIFRLIPSIDSLIIFVLSIFIPDFLFSSHSQAWNAPFVQTLLARPSPTLVRRSLH